MTLPAFDEPALMHQFRALAEWPLTDETVSAWLEQFSVLEAQWYEQLAELIRRYQADTREEVHRAALETFQNTQSPAVRQQISALVRRFQASGVQLPPPLHATFAPLLLVPDLPEATLETLSEVRVLAAEFQALQAATRYTYPEGTDGSPIEDYRSTDRARQERGFRALAQADLTAAPPLRHLFVKLHTLRQRAARQAGYASFTDLAWRMEPLTERDYSADDVRRLREQVQIQVVPLLLEVRAEKARRLGLSTLRPWDNALGVSGTSPQSQIATTEAALDAASRVFHALHHVFGQTFDVLRTRGAFDVAPRDGKLWQPYSDYLPLVRLPYVQMHLDLTDPGAVHTFFHEAGHAIHKALTDKTALFRQYFPPKELSEFFAQTMEVLTLSYLHEFYDAASQPALKLDFLERVLVSVVSTCALDEFQEQVYARPTLSENELNELYASVVKRYPMGVDWQEFEERQNMFWMSWHVFNHPYYNIEYTLAWLAVLEYWDVVEIYPQDAVHRVLELMTHPYDRPSQQFLTLIGLNLFQDKDQMELVCFSMKRRWETLILQLP
jgi:oligoendopeptidase F